MSRFLLAAAILLLLVNVVVLAGVAYNRSGAPLVSIDLTERELSVRSSFGVTRDNTATALSIKWNILGQDENPMRIISTRRLPSWLHEEKLAELGVDVEELRQDRDKSKLGTIPMLTEAILVLEYDGDTYSQALSSAESRVAELQKEASNNPDDVKLANRLNTFARQVTRLKDSESRLYIIDAGLDIQALRQKYAGKGNYLFMRGVIKLWWVENAVDGWIHGLSNGQIHIPLPFSRMTSDLTRSPHRTAPTAPRYTVHLHIGKRLEPWVESVTLIEY